MDVAVALLKSIRTSAEAFLRHEQLNITPVGHDSNKKYQKSKQEHKFQVNNWRTSPLWSNTTKSYGDGSKTSRIWRIYWHHHREYGGCYCLWIICFRSY
mmetsp:Transcript_5057/g.7311  ORF Transcript_5057/g.7311 Transcript_5057/m.7311 type:complete len:99 (+) Transcript_5057:279-575(+)